MRYHRKLPVLIGLVFALVYFGTSAEPLHSQSASQDPGPTSIELVMFDQIACKWCRMWDEQVGVVYHQTTEGKRAPLRRVDIRARMPGELQSLKSVVYTPTFVLLENGVEVGRIEGYPGEDSFWGLLEQLLGKLQFGEGVRTQGTLLKAQSGN